MTLAGTAQTTAAAQQWRTHVAALAAVVAIILVVFGADASAMAWQWWNSSAYGHCLFVLPLVGWMIWTRRDEVARVEPRSWLPGLGAVAVAALLWMAGEAAGIALVRHVALVAMVQASILTVLGPAVLRAILFPVAYLVFLVPFGAELVPPMQTLTARMTMDLLALANVPAQLDGVFITTRFGWFEVAEACAGVKFLVAMIAYGALVAHLCFRRWSRRFAFMVLCIGVPVLANGVRAFGTIYAAKMTSVEAATGFDHLVYGWFFFAIVMALVMAIAWPFFDRKVGERWLPSIPRAVGPPRPPRIVAALAGLLILVPVVWNGTVIAAGRQPLPYAVSLPTLTGWSRIATIDDWRPRFDGADHRLFGRYRNTAGATVDIGIALYGWQDQGRQLASYGQGAIDPDGQWAWSANVAAPPAGRAMRMVGPDKAARVAATFYIVDGVSTGQTLMVKLRTAKNRLLGGDQSAAVVVVSAREPGARPAIDSFMATLGPPERAAAKLLAAARGA